MIYTVSVDKTNEHNEEHKNLDVASFTNIQYVNIVDIKLFMK